MYLINKPNTHCFGSGYLTTEADRQATGKITSVSAVFIHMHLLKCDPLSHCPFLSLLVLPSLFVSLSPHDNPKMWILFLILFNLFFDNFKNVYNVSHLYSFHLLSPSSLYSRRPSYDIYIYSHLVLAICTWMWRYPLVAH